MRLHALAPARAHRPLTNLPLRRGIKKDPYFAPEPHPQRPSGQKHRESRRWRNYGTEEGGGWCILGGMRAVSLLLAALFVACASANPDEEPDVEISRPGGGQGGEGEGGESNSEGGNAGSKSTSFPQGGASPGTGGNSQAGTGDAGTGQAGTGEAGTGQAGTSATTECTPGQEEVVGACAKCGQQLRTCGPEGTWGAPSCEAQGECEAGAQDSAPCGSCGQKIRTCSNTCSWGDYGACSAQGACTPGEKDTQPCGNCGEQTRTCNDSCQWGGFGGCQGEGVCAPGATEQSDCDGCSQKVCSNSCTWSACKLKSGSKCEWKNGTSFQCCGGGQWQFCSKTTCDWFPCAACSGCGC